MMPDAPRHPDLFSAEEAAAYLHLENPATLDTLRAQGLLVHYKAGKQSLYWRRDLDDCALKIVGEHVPERMKQRPMRLAQS